MICLWTNDNKHLTKFELFGDNKNEGRGKKKIFKKKMAFLTLTSEQSMDCRR